MMTQHGRTPDRLYFDFRPLWGLRPEARLGGSIYLFPLRGAGLTR